VELSTLEGKKQFRICAVVRFYGTDLGAIWLHYPVYSRLFQDRLVHSFDIFLTFFHLLVSFLVFAHDRRRDMGLLKLIGAAARTVVKAFLVETTLLSILGCITGGALGITLGWIATQEILPLLRGVTLAFSVDWGLLVFMIFLSLLLSHFAASRPAREFTTHHLELELVAGE
jgi:predicted lysophospholipase L1 biosynthesis ABC-type transport system permease subunit